MTTTVASAITPSTEWRTGGRGGKQRLIKHPVTGEDVPVQRVSTFAKTLDTKDNLIDWMAWKAVIGAHHLPAVAAQARHAEGTPKGLIEQLAEAGGSKDKARRGSDRHAILAMALTGAALPPLPDGSRAELDRILRLIESLGTVVAVEAATACIELGTAGTVDLVLEAPDGQTIVADFKTGRHDALSHGIQLMAHARSNYYDLANEAWLDPLSRSQPRLVTLHAPQDGTEPRAIDIPVEDARRWTMLAVQVREARREAAAMTRRAA